MGALSIDWHALSPEVAVTGALLAVLVIDLFLPNRFKIFNAPIAFAGIATAGVCLGTLWGDHRTTFGGMFVLDNYAILFKLLFVAVAGVLVLISADYLDEQVRSMQGEFYFLLLTSLLGMLIMPSARDLIALFVALETVSVPGFLIAGFKKPDQRGNEAAIKFFLFGVLSSAVMLFGMSMIYGVTRSTNLNAIATALQGRHDPIVYASILLIIVGFAFKVSAVPFHFWAPDTYEGSPVPVAAFLSVASKAAGFAGLLQICFVAFRFQTNVWGPGLAILAALTMTVGNVVALQQTQMIRLLAYSSIAQAGYMLLPFGVVANQGPGVLRNAFAASLTYILIYSFINLGAFAVAIAVGRSKPANLIADYDGLSQRDPKLAVAMLVFLLGLAGMVPNVAGFFAKFVVFRAAIDGHTTWLAAVMVLNTVVGLYYYLSVGARMFLRPPSDAEPVRTPTLIVAAIALLVLVVAAVSVYPELFNHFSPHATLVAGR